MIGRINKRTFLNNLKALIKSTTKPYSTLIQYPFEDIPLNEILINLPVYSDFLNNNRKYLTDAKEYLKKSLKLIENSTILYEKNINIDDIAW